MSDSKCVSVENEAVFFLLNGFFHLLHLSIVFSSLVLCFVSGMAGIHLVVQSVILFSWLVVGPVLKKPGWCVITEIQKSLHQRQGSDFPDYYMAYLFRKVGLQINNEKKVDRVICAIFAGCTALSLFRFF